jgi:hypothetical protein
MGGAGFETYHKGASMDAAYNEACIKALNEYGNNGYNGTISTTDGCQQVVYTPMTAKGAAAYSDHDNDTHKWGPAHAIPVAADDQFTFTKEKFTVELPAVIKCPARYPGDCSSVEHGTTEWDLRDAANKQAFDTYAHHVHEVAINCKLKTKIVVEAAKGRSVNRYQLGNQPQFGSFATKALAIAAAKGKLTKGYGAGNIKIHTVRYWPESDTTDAAVVRKVTVRAVADVTVTVSREKAVMAPYGAASRPDVVGWLFYGVASC